jgi:RNA polymerase sigma-70 factor (ECF subfamily)
MSDDTLEELLARCALGNEKAFSALYRTCAPKLFATAFRITRRRDWAEEVLQESFVNIWHHAQGYEPGRSAPMTWMTAIVRNRALDWLRRAPQGEGTDDTYQLLLAMIADESPGPEELLSRSFEAGRLGDCLAELNEEQRRSIVLGFFHGMSHSELASHFGKPLGTVKTWIRRGLARLRACLDES